MRENREKSLWLIVNLLKLDIAGCNEVIDTMGDVREGTKDCGYLRE